MIPTSPLHRLMLSALVATGALLVQTAHAQTVNPYVVNGTNTSPAPLVVTGTAPNDVVTTLSGPYNPSSAFADTSTNTSVTVGANTAIMVTSANNAIQIASGTIKNFGSVTTTNTAESAIVTTGTPTTIFNAGTLTGGASGVAMTGGTLTNSSTGVIIGQNAYGVTSIGAATTVNNYGIITSNATALAVGPPINITYTAVNLGPGATYNSYSGIINTPTVGQTETYGVTLNGVGNTASLSGLTRFNGTNVADISGGTTGTLALNFIGGTQTAYTNVGGTGSITIGGYTYTFANFSGGVTNNSRSLLSLAASSPQAAAASALDNSINLANSTNIHPANLATLDNALTAIYLTNPGAVPAALSQLSPEEFAHFASSTAFNNAAFETQAMDDYLASQRNGPNGSFSAGSGQIDASGLTLNDPNTDSGLQLVHSRMLAFNPAPDAGSGLLSDVPSGVDMSDKKDMKDTKSCASCAYNNPWNVFIRGNVILAQGFSQADQPHFDDNTESVTVGTDYRFTPNFLVGATLAYAHTDVTLDPNNSSATVDSYSPGIYASYADSGWYANFNGNYNYNSYTQSRNIAFLGQTANSATDGNEGVVNTDFGYDFHSGALSYGPLAGIQYTHLTVNGYSESGSAADLSVNSNDADSLRSRLGGEVSYKFSDAGMCITPHLSAAWQHEFLDQSRGITSAFNTFGGGSFTVQTLNPSRESALVDLGVTADLNRTVSVFTDYIAQAGQDDYFGQSVQAGVKIGF